MPFWAFEWVISRLPLDDEDTAKFGDDANAWPTWSILLKSASKANTFIISSPGISSIES